MKLRTILATAAMLMASICVQAESHYRPHIWLGGRAGATLGMVSFSPSVKQLWNTGTTGALTFRYSEEKLFGVIAELGWIQRGWKENYELLPFAYNRTLTYINLPLLTHIYFGSPRFKGFVNLGPEFGFYLGDRISASFDYMHPDKVEGYPTRTRQTEQLYAPVTGKFDYGICGSVGLEFYVQPRHSIAVECRYYFGLGNIFPSAKADTFSASRNMSIALTLGYNFRIQ